MAKWKQMENDRGFNYGRSASVPTMSITAWANAETEVTVDNFESEILPNLAIKEDGTPLKVAITVAELDSEYVIAVQKYAQYLLETAGAEVTVSSADGDVENQCNQIYDFIEKGVDVVLIQAADSNAVAPASKSMQ
ncbi:MAG: substrate-binding domain-containing protein [Blautia wexlerae]